MLLDMLCADFLATADLPDLFSSAGGWTVVAGEGARGNDAFACASSVGLLQRTPMQTPSGSKVVVGFRFKTTGLPAARQIWSAKDTGTDQLSLGLNTDGTLRLKTGDFTFGTTLGTSTTTLQAGTNYFIEIEAVIHSSTGSATVYINGVAAIGPLTNVDTQATASTTWNTYSFNGIGSGDTSYVSDIYAADGTSGDITAVIGDCRVDAHAPTSDGGVDEWTPSTGTDAYAMLDEAAPDDDTTYIESGTNDQRTVCGFDDLIPTGAAIKGIAVVWNMKKTDAGASTVAPVIRQSATNYDGTAQAPSDSAYAYFGQVYEQDPDTSAAWTESGFESAEFGVKKVS